MAYFRQYSPEKRKRIALWCTVIVGVVLVLVLVIVYTTQPFREHRSFSAIILGGYTTIVEGIQSYFSGK